MQFELSPRPRRRLIGLTPLIDVVFILLLFFMLASRLTQLHVVPISTPVAAPAAQDLNQQGRAPALLLRVRGQGQLDLNGEPVTLDGLPAALASWLTRRPALRVLVLPSDQVQLQTTMQVFDQLAAAGVLSVALL